MSRCPVCNDPSPYVERAGELYCVKCGRTISTAGIQGPSQVEQEETPERKLRFRVVLAFLLGVLVTLCGVAGTLYIQRDLATSLPDTYQLIAPVGGWKLNTATGETWRFESGAWNSVSNAPNKWMSVLGDFREETYSNWLAKQMTDRWTAVILIMASLGACIAAGVLAFTSVSRRNRK